MSCRRDLIWNDGKLVHACEGEHTANQAGVTFPVWTLCKKLVPANESRTGAHSEATCACCQVTMLAASSRPDPAMNKRASYLDLLDAKQAVTAMGRQMGVTGYSTLLIVLLLRKLGGRVEVVHDEILTVQAELSSREAKGEALYWAMSEPLSAPTKWIFSENKPEFAETKKVLHLAEKLPEEEEYVVTMCHLVARKFVTTDLAQVSCSNCIDYKLAYLECDLRRYENVHDQMYRSVELASGEEAINYTKQLTALGVMMAKVRTLMRSLRRQKL